MKSTPWALPSNRIVCKTNRFEPAPAYSVKGVNSFPPLRSQIHAAVTTGPSQAPGDLALREINEGLNIVEQWYGATDFVFFAKRGEFTSNRREDHEITALCLHLLQNCMVYINTLMMQRDLGRPEWSPADQRMTPLDFRALTPLVGSTSTLTAATNSI
jgi:hypothetical protein